MKKISNIILALLLIPFLFPVVRAISNTVVGPTQSVNTTQVGGTAVTTGAGSSNGGTQRVILASDSPSGSISAGANQIGTVNGSTVTAVGQFLSSPPSLANGATSNLMVDTNANLKVNVAVALPAGSAIIGNVRIDQTTPGTTNGVVASIASAQTLATVTTVGAVTAITNALPAGSNTIGAVNIASQVGGAINVVSTMPAQGTYNIPPLTLAGGTTASIQLDVQGNIYSRQIGAGFSRGVPVVTRVGCTTSSGQLLAGNANRVGLECDSDAAPDNTDKVFIRQGAVAATNNDKRLEIGASWQPPTVSTVAVQCVSKSATQNVTCIEYNNQ